MAYSSDRYPLQPSRQHRNYTDLHVSARIPVRIKEYHSVRTGEVDAYTARSGCQKHDEHRIVAIETVDETLRGNK